MQGNEIMLDANTLEILGLSQDELREKIIESVSEKLLVSVHHDDDSEEHHRGSRLRDSLENHIKKIIDSRIEAMAEKHVLPLVSTMVENISLQATNEWGQPKSPPLTFIEYLIKRAEAYLSEKVDSSGKTKADQRYPSDFRENQTRVTFLIHSHLANAIETAMKTAIDGANKNFIVGLHETVRLKLNEIAAQMKVTVTAKV